MNILGDYLDTEKKSVATLGKELRVSRTTAHRLATGERFSAIRKLFFKIYKITKLTPNEILNIPPREKGGDVDG